MKGKISISGFRKNSPDKDNDFNVIPSNKISMKGVKFPVHGVDDTGHEIMMMPGAEYKFPGNFVMETPMKNKDMEANGYMKKGGNWIPKHLKKGRCTPAPNADCPVGSPQYNLAMTFKKHHGFHQMGGPTGPMSVSQWDAYHASQGNLPLPYTVTGAAPSKYKQYYNPNNYKGMELTGSMMNSVKDQDIFQYKAPINTMQKLAVAPTSDRKIDFTPNGKIITYPDGRQEHFDLAGNPIQPLVQSYKFGGSKDDFKTFMVNYMSKKMGGPMDFKQGQDMDSYLSENMKIFKDYLAKNVMTNMISDEADNFYANKGFKQMGGDIQDDQDIQVPLSPEEQAQKDLYDQQQRGMAIDNTPWYGPGPNAENSALNYNTPISFGTNGFNQFSKNNGMNMANAAIAGTNFLASMFEQSDRKAAERKMKLKYSTDNLFAPVDSTMNKGNYDTNTGKFRPNNYTPNQFKEGGVVHMSDDEIKEFLCAGGTLKYMD